jgi:hypothetical protein
VFTEHGAIMLASVLNSPVAVEASIRPGGSTARLNYPQMGQTLRAVVAIIVYVSG